MKTAGALFVLPLFVASCNPFIDEIEMMEFVNGNCKIKWVDVYGILDQTPYSHLMIDSCGKKDTIHIYDQIEYIVSDDPNSIVYIDSVSAEASKGEVEKMISYGLKVKIIDTPKRCFERYNHYIGNTIDDLLMDYQGVTDIIKIKTMRDKDILFLFNYPNETILLITMHFYDKNLFQTFCNYDKYVKSMFFENNIRILRLTVINRDAVIISLPYNDEIGKLYGEDRIRYFPQ